MTTPPTDEELIRRFTEAVEFVKRGIADGTYCPSVHHCTRCRWGGCIRGSCRQNEGECPCAPFHLGKVTDDG
jgi:hypothetical protein